MKKFSRLLITILILSTFCLTACSSKRHHETSTTTTREAHSPEVITTTSSTTTEESSSSASTCGGILSCTVDVVGAVIAFPFKVVGGLITAIF